MVKVKQQASGREDIPVQEPIRLAMSSGYTVLVEPMGYQATSLLLRKERALFPDPEEPTQEIEAVDGPRYLPVSTSSDEYRAYLTELREVRNRRAEWRVDHLIDHYLTVEGAEDEAGQQALVEKHTNDLARLELLLEDPIPDDERWDYVLRHVVLFKLEDYHRLQQTIMDLAAAVTNEEVLEAARNFRGAVPEHADPGREAASGAQD